MKLTKFFMDFTGVMKYVCGYLCILYSLLFIITIIFGYGSSVGLNSLIGYNVFYGVHYLVYAIGESVLMRQYEQELEYLEALSSDDGE